ncbi:protein adenylyltransferase SelO family protein [Mesorhizobium sp. M1340]|uniref:protein adenylyltransferase SelO family protein n=1 Tax=unclassified Mesorhizobium TaxID=325217 RepID=UPI003338951E
MLVGFIHGVMAISGRRSITALAPSWTYMILGRYSARSIKFGLYAYVNEPHIAVWNLTRFTETLLPLLNEDGDEAVSEAERQFQSRYEATFHRGISRRLELLSEPEGGLAACERSFEAMARGGADFTLTFRRPGKARRDNCSKSPAHSTPGQGSGASAWHAYQPRWHFANRS